MRSDGRCPSFLGALSIGRYFVRKITFASELMVSYFYLMIASDPCFANLGPSLLWNFSMVAWPDGALRSGRGGFVGHIRAKPRHSNMVRSGLKLTAKLSPDADPEPDRCRSLAPVPPDPPKLLGVCRQCEGTAEAAP